MATPATFVLHDRLLKGTLTRRLQSWRGDGLTYDDIAAELRQLGTYVSRETVRRWCHQLDID